MHDHLIIKPEFSLDEAWNQVFHELKRATVDPRHPFRTVWLSTMMKDGHPNCRTVVFRKLQDEQRLFIYTDIRSDKAKEIDQNPAISLVFYNPHKKLQVKVLGTGVLHHSNEITEQEWKESGHRGAHSYTSTKAPGEVITNPAEAFQWDLEDASNFCVIEVFISEMEFLQLNGTQHLRSNKRNNELVWITP